MSGILSGKEIKSQIKNGDIEISPFDPELVNVASVDLRLGEMVRMYETNNSGRGALGRVALDCRTEPMTHLFEMNPTGFVLQPGELYLMHTVERVFSNRFVPVLDGKSSIGRLGICVHLTAGYGDPGFNGQYTLEVTTVYPVRVYPRMRFCQMRFHMIEGEVQQYTGNYTGGAAMGPVASRCWKQFQ